MNNYEVITIGSFDEKLNNINEFLLDEYGKKVVIAFLDELKENTDNLQCFPRMYKEAKIGVLAERGFREFNVKQNTIYYLVDDEKEKVILVSICNHKQGVRSRVMETLYSCECSKNLLDNDIEYQQEENENHKITSRDRQM